MLVLQVHEYTSHCIQIHKLLLVSVSKSVGPNPWVTRSFNPILPPLRQPSHHVLVIWDADAIHSIRIILKKIKMDYIYWSILQWGHTRLIKPISEVQLPCTIPRVRSLSFSGRTQPHMKPGPHTCLPHSLYNWYIPNKLFCLPKYIYIFFFILDRRFLHQRQEQTKKGHIRWHPFSGWITHT